MNKDDLKEVFKEAKENKNGICVEIQMPNQNTTEKIINDYEALDAKLTYYLCAYDSELIHNNARTIRIIKPYPYDWYEVDEDGK